MSHWSILTSPKQENINILADLNQDTKLFQISEDLDVFKALQPNLLFSPLIIITGNRHIVLIIMHFAYFQQKKTLTDHKLAQQRGEIAPSACFSNHDAMILTLSLGRAATIAMNSSSVTSRSPTISSLNTCRYAKCAKYAKICNKCKICKIF